MNGHAGVHCCRRYTLAKVCQLRSSALMKKSRKSRPKPSITVSNELIESVL